MDALVGYTGFVGSNLAAQHPFGACFNSKNIESIRGRSFRTLVISGMPAAKWLANRDPLGDRAVLEHLWSCVSECEAQTVVVISTVDVYPAPIGVDEDTWIEQTFQQTYGKHRLDLEHRAMDRFAHTLVVRLPGLYGPGLKKNAVFDLLHGNEVHKVPAAGSFQFYDLNHLWSDIQACLTAGLSLVNLSTEPVTIREVAREAFGIDFSNNPGGTPPRYDVRTKHASVLGGRDGYLEPRAAVLAGLRDFVASERQRLPVRVAA